jgi:hypothetical protein
MQQAEAQVQEPEGLEWPELVTALDIDRHDTTVYRIGHLIIKTLYQSDIGLVGWVPAIARRGRGPRCAPRCCALSLSPCSRVDPRLEIRNRWAGAVSAASGPSCAAIRDPIN